MRNVSRLDVVGGIRDVGELGSLGVEIYLQRIEIIQVSSYQEWKSVW